MKLRFSSIGKFLVASILSFVLLVNGTHARDENAPHNHPVKVIAPERAIVATSAGKGELPLYISHDWSIPQPNIDRVVIVLHGRLRDADTYWDTAQKFRIAAGGSGKNTMLIVPQFLATADISAHNLGKEVLRWGYDHWMGGENALAPAKISSYESIDAICAKLADRSRFPSLRQVAIVGHSAGAQVVQRYAVVGRGEANLKDIGIAVRYIVANPSSYLYFNEDRPNIEDTEGEFSPFKSDRCPNFNNWKYGWVDAPKYATLYQPDEYEKIYAARDVVYLLGTADINPNHPALDKSCAAEAQGSYRYARGLAYASYIKKRNPDSQHRIYPVIGVGHDGDRMLRSQCGLAAIFDLGNCSN